MFCYVNGKFVSSEKAAIPIEDRGLRFGDGLFETIAVYDSIPYQWELHIKRLEKGLKSLKIKYNAKALKSPGNKLIEKNKIKSGILRIMITRGSGSKGYLPTGKFPTTIIEAYPSPFKSLSSVALAVSSLKKISSKSIPSAKHNSSLLYVLARMEAEEKGAADSILLTDNDNISETSSGNIFWFKNNILYTPSVASDILTGTTRDAILRISPYKTKQGLFKMKDLLVADEVFICNSVWKILPVCKILGYKKNWRNSQLTKNLTALLEVDIKKYVNARKKKMG